MFRLPSEKEEHKDHNRCFDFKYLHYYRRNRRHDIYEA